jgi:putative Ca2+/H+ antiporter (TMEM165/GDT1 family)
MLGKTFDHVASGSAGEARGHWVSTRPGIDLLEAFFLSTGLVALAEVGDKTQLLAFLLAARWRRPAPIIAGILVATLVNHALAAALGTWLQSLLDPPVLRWVVGISFIVMAGWTLIPDELDADDAPRGDLGIFGATALAFFIAEMGDKTQLATVALAAKVGVMWTVVAGTTAGMMLANVPAVLLGERLAGRIPVAWVHRVAAALFAALGVATLLGAGGAIGL